MSERWSTVAMVVGVAAVAMAGPVLLAWVSNGPMRIAAKAGVVILEDEDAEEDTPDIGWLPGNER